MHHLQSANVCFPLFGSDNGKEISFERKYGKQDLLVSKYTLPFRPFKENSFNMTRGDEVIEGGFRKFLPIRKGGSEKTMGGPFKNVYTLNPKGGGGAPKKLNCYRGGLLKFQASSFNIVILPCHIK